MLCFAMFRLFTLAETHIETGNHKMAHWPSPVSLKGGNTLLLRQHRVGGGNTLLLRRHA